MRNIETVVGERPSGLSLREHHSGSIDYYLIRQRIELQKILTILDVRDRQFTVSMIPELPQGDVSDGGNAVSEMKQHVQKFTDTETSTHVSTVVRRFSSLQTTPH